MSDSSGHSCEICAEFVLDDRTACNILSNLDKKRGPAGLFRVTLYFFSRNYEVNPLKTTSAGPVI